METLCSWNVILYINSLINKLYICENLASILVIDSDAISRNVYVKNIDSSPTKTFVIAFDLVIILSIKILVFRAVNSFFYLKFYYFIVYFCKGAGKKPMFGDYEAQRHWMEISYNLPVKEW